MKSNHKIYYLFLILLLISVDRLTSQDGRGVDEPKGLEPGTEAPLFRAMDADSNSFSLENALIEGPVVLIFYRGFWCPVCNKHLAKLQDSLALIEQTGAKVVAVSPEKPEYLEKMSEQTGADFSLLYDEGYRISDAYDVTFKPTSLQLFTYNVVLDGKLKKTHSDDAQYLPIPATYIIDSDGRIRWKQLDPDYKNRATVKDIVTVLYNLNNQALKSLREPIPK